MKRIITPCAPNKGSHRVYDKDGYLEFHAKRGSKAQVFNGTARRTCGSGLYKGDLTKNKFGKIVSLKKQRIGRANYKKLMKNKSFKEAWAAHKGQGFPTRTEKGLYKALNGPHQLREVEIGKRSSAQKAYDDLDSGIDFISGPRSSKSPKSKKSKSVKAPTGRATRSGKMY
jgi:hypothetical protein